MAKEPKKKRTTVFIDGQGLFLAVKDAFGYNYPNYDVKKLSEKICITKKWDIGQIRFYTGIHDSQVNNFWYTFWTNKLSHMGQVGVEVFSRTLRYRNETVTSPDGKKYTVLVGREKGIDIRIALDVIRLAHENAYDVGLIFSQDQDFSEVADEVRRIIKEKNRWIKVASAFPTSPTYDNTRGINKTEWIKIDRSTYDSCIDPKDYRGKFATP